MADYIIIDKTSGDLHVLISTLTLANQNSVPYSFGLRYTFNVSRFFSFRESNFLKINTKHLQFYKIIKKTNDSEKLDCYLLIYIFISGNLC